MSLLNALRIIQMFEEKKVTAIMYEDGSMTKFVFQLDMVNEWIFKDLSRMLELLNQD